MTIEDENSQSSEDIGQVRFGGGINRPEVPVPRSNDEQHSQEGSLLGPESSRSQQLRRLGEDLISDMWDRHNHRTQAYASLTNLPEAVRKARAQAALDRAEHDEEVLARLTKDAIDRTERLEQTP